MLSFCNYLFAPFNLTWLSLYYLLQSFAKNLFHDIFITEQATNYDIRACTDAPEALEKAKLVLFLIIRWPILHWMSLTSASSSPSCACLSSPHPVWSWITCFLTTITTSHYHYLRFHDITTMRSTNLQHLTLSPSFTPSNSTFSLPRYYLSLYHSMIWSQDQGGI